MKTNNKSSPLFPFPLPPDDRKGKKQEKRKEPKEKINKKGKDSFPPLSHSLFLPEKENARLYTRDPYFSQFFGEDGKGRGKNEGKAFNSARLSLSCLHTLGSVSRALCAFHAFSRVIPPPLALARCGGFLVTVRLCGTLPRSLLFSCFFVIFTNFPRSFIIVTTICTIS